MNGRNVGDPTESGLERRSAAGGRRVDDEAAVGDRVDHDSMLQEAVEEQAATPRAATVEAEGELVEVSIEVLVADATLVGAQQPTLEKARDAVHARHHDMRGIILLAHDRPLVLVAALRELPVRLPPVGVDGRAGLHRLVDEREQVVGGDIRGRA